MIDTWFKEDLQGIYDQHSVAVLVDESGDAEFLLKSLDKRVALHRAQGELEELHIKYLIEKSQPSDQKFLIYVCTPKDGLKFIREYCETDGCLEISHLQNYIKDKVHQTLNLNLNLPAEELISAAKVSVGKDRTYWMDLCHKGATEIFDLGRELLPFLHDPKAYAKERFDDKLYETFARKISELLEQEYIKKPPATLAGEVVKRMLDGLANGKADKTLEEIYQSWQDSMTYKSSLDGYLKKYKLPSDLELWKVSPHHPFRQVDEKWLEEVGKPLPAQSISKEALDAIRGRNKSRQARSIGVKYWADVLVLLEYEPKDILGLNSLAECVEYYQKRFHKLDTAIRNLYAEFLNKKNLIEPLQELYKQHASVFLDQWFKHWAEYEEGQTGTLQKIIDDNKGKKIAVIVGDGVAYEIAQLIAQEVGGGSPLTKGVILADIPSETENNMSRIFMDNGIVEGVHSKREKYLAEQNPNLDIDFMRLDEVSEEARPGQVLVCASKDIDDMGEKLQQKALKYFPETIEFIAEKISVLLEGGYAKVYLIADHGFVLTGILSEADKVTVEVAGDAHKSERYIRTKDLQGEEAGSYIHAERSYKQYKHIYFSRTLNPFKTPGVYGYSHGGASPQEVVTPFFCWEREADPAGSLPLFISNKSDLKQITGELFSIKVEAGEGADDLFSMERKAYLVFFSGGKQVNKSEVFSLKPRESHAKEYTFDGHVEYEAQLLDATTKEQLDRVVIKKSSDRDLGGLL